MTTTTTTTTTTSAATSTSTIAPTALQDATVKSTIAWQTDLEALFHRAKDRFPDVVWALLTEGDAEPTGEQVYGHKGIYLRLLSIYLPAHLPRTFPFLPIHTVPTFSAICDISTYPNSQLSYTLALHQASRHDISHFALPPHYLQAPWMYILHPAFLPSPLSLFPLVLKSPPCLAPPPPFALHRPFHKVKMA
jgi:hypothetical protein